MNRKAFTLVELVVVILILGILAGVAAPRFLDTAGEASDASLRQSLAIVRDAIELYTAENNGDLPPHNGDPAGAGSLNDALLPYLRRGIPDCPVGPQPNNTVGAAADPTDVDTVGAAAPLTGWLYNTATGSFICAFNGQTNANDGTTYDSL